MALFIPTVEGRDASSIIVKALSKKQGMNAKQVYNSIKEGENRDFSYQAIHKALQKLQKESIVVKIGPNYFLSQNWLENIKQFAESSKLNPEKSILFENTTWPKNLQFSTLIELAYFLFNSVSEIYANSKEKKTAAVHLRRSWPWMFFNREEYAQLVYLFKSRKRFVLVNKDLFADRFLGSFYEKLGTQIKYGVACANDCDVQVENDYIFYIYYAPELKKKLDAVYEKIGKEKDAALPDLFSLVHNYKNKINVVLNKNESIAEQIRRETIEHFE